MAAVKDINDLRRFLAEELEKLSDGETTPAAANAAANLSGKILSSVKLELEYQKISGSTGNINFIKKNGTLLEKSKK